MKKVALIILVGGLFSWANGQDPQFTQFYANPLYLAPSFAGATEQDRISTAYRNQWPGILNGVFVTYSFAYDHFFENFNSGVGVLLLRDVAGTGKLGLLNAGILYSYDIQVTQEFHLRPGVHFNYTQQGIDFNALRWNSDVALLGGANVEPGALRSRPDVDFSTSLLAYTNKAWGGFSVDHLLRPNYGLYWNDVRWPIKVTLFGGYQIIKRGQLTNPIDETVSVAFYYRHQHVYNQVDAGLYWYKPPVMFGIWYRGIPFFKGPDGERDRGDALAFLIGYKMNQLRVGYSYDFTISKLVATSGGAHEVSITYEFKTTRQRRNARMIPCPEY